MTAMNQALDRSFCEITQKLERLDHLTLLHRLWSPVAHRGCFDSAMDSTELKVSEWVCVRNAQKWKALSTFVSTSASASPAGFGVGVIGVIVVDVNTDRQHRLKDQDRLVAQSANEHRPTDVDFGISVKLRSGLFRKKRIYLFQVCFFVLVET